MFKNNILNELNQDSRLCGNGEGYYFLLCFRFCKNFNKAA